jgi:hypothetical protein
MESSRQEDSTVEFDEDFFEWEERDESISYVKHCIGKII